MAESQQDTSTSSQPWTPEPPKGGPDDLAKLIEEQKRREEEAQKRVSIGAAAQQELNQIKPVLDALNAAKNTRQAIGDKAAVRSEKLNGAHKALISTELAAAENATKALCTELGLNPENLDKPLKSYSEALDKKDAADAAVQEKTSELPARRAALDRARKVLDERASELDAFLATQEQRLKEAQANLAQVSKVLPDTFAESYVTLFRSKRLVEAINSAMADILPKKLSNLAAAGADYAQKMRDILTAEQALASAQKNQREAVEQLTKVTDQVQTALKDEITKAIAAKNAKPEPGKGKDGNKEGSPEQRSDPQTQSSNKPRKER